MDTKLITTNIRLSQWNLTIKDRIDSGLTVNEYCAEKGLSRNAYYYWLRRVKEAAVNSCSNAFAELLQTEAAEPSEQEATFVPQIVIRTNHLSIEVNGDTSRDVLSMVLEVARNAQ